MGIFEVTPKRFKRSQPHACTGQDFRRLRLGAGHTQDSLSALVGIAKHNISAMENNRRKITPKVLDRVKAALAAESSNV